MNIQGESSSSSHFSYDVFLSFRGEDTRKTFTGHLYTRLSQVGVNTFIDDEELRKGDLISTELEKAIEQSRISIVVFSKSYASSSWCLDELVKILDCRERLNHVVLPIFYNVDPSQVRKQTGSFGEALAKHKERLIGAERVDKWRAALTDAANLSGWDLRNVADGHESKFIESIIKQVLQVVNQIPLDVAHYPIGLDSRIKHIELLLQSGCEHEVRMVGICGVGGIGKTTLAKAIYNREFRKFDSSFFLSDVRSKVEELGLVKLQEKLLHQILKTKDFEVDSFAEGVNLIIARLGSKKVLIVLDDVDHRSQLESLTRERSWFGSGSLIIITTRDEHLLCGLTTSEIYQAKLLNDNEAQQLFSGHALNSFSPPQDYVDLAKDIIKYSGGLPLALVTLGSHLHGKSVEEWRLEFEKLRAIPHNDIQKILKISFDGLDLDTKTVFLDIACAFHDLTEYEVTKTLNTCGFYFESAITTLLQKHLLQKDGVYLVMHDLVRNMGREIVRSESPQYPGKRSRLFIPEEVYNVLQGNNASENVEILKLDRAGELKGVELSTEAFEPMKKLRVLIINELRISGDFGLFSKELRWLSWQKCPLQYIPPNFPAANLVVLNMQESDIEEFDLNLQFCKKLKELNLSYCKRLRKISNFNGARSLETLQLQYCNLSEVPRDIGSLSSLISLDLSGNGFHGLRFDFSKLRLLKELHLNDCENLQTVPSVSNLKNLEILELKNCRKLVKITELDNLPSIVWINMRNCTSLQNPFNESFFSAPALSSKKNPYQILRICVQCNEIPDWCSNKVTAPSIRFTMPTVHNNKFLGMVLWFVCDFLDVSTFRYFVVTVGNKKLFLTWNRYTETPQLHGEVSCVYYISHSNRPFDCKKIKGEEKIEVEEEVYEGTIKKIGIHLLYLDQHGNVTSLPAVVYHPPRHAFSMMSLTLYDEYHYV